MLSKRLLEITKFVEKNKVVYDVGSDHGLLPCFLILNDICNKVYAGDNKIGPLNKAKDNIQKYNLVGKVIPVLANGIDGINNDVDILILAGMGFYTVKDILNGKDLNKYSKIIVQVNKDVDKLRAWINDNNYSIIQESVVYDDFYYEIVCFNASKTSKLSPKEIKYGPINLINKTDTFKKYLAYKRTKIAKNYVLSNKPEYKKELEELDAIINSCL